MFCVEYWRIDETQIPTNAKCDILPFSRLTGTHNSKQGFKNTVKTYMVFLDQMCKNFI
jgi:hypothetical protein